MNHVTFLRHKYDLLSLIFFIDVFLHQENQIGSQRLQTILYISGGESDVIQMKLKMQQKSENSALNLLASESWCSLDKREDRKSIHVM